MISLPIPRAIVSLVETQSHTCCDGRHCEREREYACDERQETGVIECGCRVECSFNVDFDPTACWSEQISLSKDQAQYANY